MKKENRNSGVTGNYDRHYRLSTPISRKHIWSVVLGIYAVLFVIIGYFEIRDKTIYNAMKHNNNSIVEYADVTSIMKIQQYEIRREASRETNRENSREYKQTNL